jgi:hypothetical protein
MRGHIDPRGPLFSYFLVEERIPRDHPPRHVKSQPEAVLASIKAAFDVRIRSAPLRYRSHVDQSDRRSLI